MIYQNNQAALRKWMTKRCGWVPTAYSHVIANADADGVVHWAIGFDDWNRVSCQVHIAGEPGGLSRELLRAAFHYGFVHLGCQILIAPIMGENEKALEINRRLGFTVEHRIKDAAPYGDIIITSLHRRNCRWLER